MVRPLAATALAAAALVATHQIPTAEAAGKSYEKGHKVELWVSKVRPQSGQAEWAQDVPVFCFVAVFGGGSRHVESVLFVRTLATDIWTGDGKNNAGGRGGYERIAFGRHLLVDICG